MIGHEQSHYFDLVCEAGCVKGIGLAGAYSLLEERRYQPHNCAGMSAGALAAALIAIAFASGTAAPRASAMAR